LPAGERDHRRESRYYIHRATMSTDGRSDVERQFHLVECAPETRSRHRQDSRIAFVADELGLVSVDEGVQAAAAVGIPEARMRKGRAYDLVLVHGCPL
jgi:hypothetical protein